MQPHHPPPVLLPQLSIEIIGYKIESSGDGDVDQPSFFVSLELSGDDGRVVLVDHIFLWC